MIEMKFHQCSPGVSGRFCSSGKDAWIKAENTTYGHEAFFFFGTPDDVREVRDAMTAYPERLDREAAQ